jgi:PAS domain S-box-containing protein
MTTTTMELHTLHTDFTLSEFSAYTKAMLNILEDFLAEKIRMENTQYATRNILEDFATEKIQLEDAQRAMLNIIEDFGAEQKKLKENTEKLAESEDKFRYVFEHSIIGKSLTYFSGEIHVNNAFCDMLGYSQEELKNKRWQDITHQDDIEPNQAILDQIISGEKDSARFTKRYIHKNGSVIWVDVSTFLRLDNDKPLYFITSIIDITDRKQAEDALKEKTEELIRSNTKLEEIIQKYRAIVDYSPDMIWTVDKDGCYTFVNKSAEKVSGYTFEQLKGHCFEPLLSKEELSNILDIFHKMLLGQTQRYEFSFTNTRGETRIISASGTPLYLRGNIIGVSNIGTDITEQRMYERQLQKTKEQLERSNKELSEFVYIASHDLQQPVRTIISYIELISDRLKKICEKDSETEEFSNIVISSANHMQEMIQDLLSLSRIERKGKPFKETNISTVLNQVLINLHTYIKQTNAKISIGEMPTIYGDETQLIQLFQNLIDNAIKFRNPGTNPEINISATISTKKNCNANETDTNHCATEYIFSVKDNGIGIDPKYFDQLFIIFHRLNSEYQGTGIGLAIAKKIVDRHNGKIWVESEGKGSTFKFTIPIDDHHYAKQ